MKRRHERDNDLNTLMCHPYLTNALLYQLGYAGMLPQISYREFVCLADSPSAKRPHKPLKTLYLYKILSLNPTKLST